MFSQGYLIDTQICIVALWLFYIAVLHRRINLPAARVYLLGMLPVAMLLPLLRIPLLPAIQLQEQMIQVAVSTVPADTAPAPGISVFQILTWLYWSGAILAGLLTLFGIARTWRRTKKAPARNIGADRIVFSPDVAGAYSVFGTIFVNDKYEESPMLGQILAHERSHIGHRHSLDLVWMSLWRSLLWFNPFVWHTFKLLREVHEFQADRDVIRQGASVEPYINLLICTEAGIYPGTANALCYSLTKKRLKMITRATRRTGIGGYLRLASLLPLTGLLLGAFSLTAKAAEPLENEPLSAPVVPTDTLRQISISVEPVTDTINIRVEPIPATKVASRQVNTFDPDVKPDTTRKFHAVFTAREPAPDTYPIRVVDGIIYTDATKITELSNPADYESITVLKGKAATSAYGEKGRSGVIVITTKKTGRNGRLTIHNGEIRTGQSVIIGNSVNFDNENAKKVTVTISKKEKRKGLTISGKLLENYPELFEQGPDGTVTNRVPVSIVINEE